MLRFVNSLRVNKGMPHTVMLARCDGSDVALGQPANAKR